ncbi:hypothetical protein BH09BAC5_BH09BAC5_03670 [soil metagenome]
MTKRIIPGKFLPAFLLAVVFIFLSGLTLHANPEEKKKLKYDSTSVVKREATTSQQEKYNKDEVWRYDRDKTNVDPQETVFDRMWNGFWDKVQKSLFSGNHGRDFNPWNILWILILVTLIVLVILKVTNSGVSTIFSGKSRKAEKTDATLEDVDIHAIDYEKQIHDAISNLDYRLAVRLWFLRTLKTLSDNELLTWQIDKTNSDYYYELSGSNYQKDFGDVSNVYDYIWYGEFPVDANSYSKAEDKFKSLRGKIEKK